MIATLTDVRGTDLFKEMIEIAQTWRGRAVGSLVSISDVSNAPDGQRAAFVGNVIETQGAAPVSRIFVADFANGLRQQVTFGPGVDRLPKWSPDGNTIAFLSDAQRAGDFQVWLLDYLSGSLSDGPAADGWVEYLEWSGDGQCILARVAGHGAELAGIEGGTVIRNVEQEQPSWLASIEVPGMDAAWRKLWIFDLKSSTARLIPADRMNAWESVWSGKDFIAAIASKRPNESAWYTATVDLIDVASGTMLTVHRAADQLGCLSASPAGDHLAVVEAVCSDRLLVAGNLLVIATEGGEVEHVDTLGIDVTYTEWQTNDTILIAGVRANETVIAVVTTKDLRCREVLSSLEHTCGDYYPVVAGVRGRPGVCTFDWEGFATPPALVALDDKGIRPIFETGRDEECSNVRASVISKPYWWVAEDGLKLEGWLHLPCRVVGPVPLVMTIHGGPIWRYRPGYFGKLPPQLMAFLRRGYAIFQPNPRGSTGHGQTFSRAVTKDMGGADGRDCLAGIDALVRDGIVDGTRLIVTGTSYGGFMAAWLSTQDQRFAAAIPICPVTDWVSASLTSQCEAYFRIALDGELGEPDSQYVTRSPIYFASKSITPTLNVCGAIDLNTPPGQAVEFHRALAAAGCETALITYPEEGHAIRRYPATCDLAARMVSWVETHVPARRQDGCD